MQKGGFTPVYFLKAAATISLSLVSALVPILRLMYQTHIKGLSEKIRESGQ